MWILALVFGIPAGFGLAFWLFASRLEKSNNIGDSTGEPSIYTDGMRYIDRTDRMGMSGKKTDEYLDAHAVTLKPSTPQPDDSRPVERFIPPSKR